MPHPFNLTLWLQEEIHELGDIRIDELMPDITQEKWADIGHQLSDRATSLELVQTILNAHLTWDCNPTNKTLQVHIAERVRIYLWTGVTK